jgi:GT2 family glycosyltransferase
MNFKDIFVVIVLYKTRLEDSKTIQTFNAALDDNVDLMVFDNSPQRQYASDNFVFNKFKIQYYHNGVNPGLSYAYNLALNKAKIVKANWLLLLDQDTSFTKEYVKEIISLEINKISKTVVSVVPRVVSLKNNEIIAPTKMFLGGICRPFSISSGVINTSISGINSGTLLSVSFMNSINGFCTKYTLDMVDHWYFREIINNGKSVYLMESIIKQDLSVFGNFEENISFARYQQLLNAEFLFINGDGIISLFVFKVRLVFRILKQIRYKNKEYYKFTLKEIFRLKYQIKNNLNKC